MGDRDKTMAAAGDSPETIEKMVSIRSVPRTTSLHSLWFDEYDTNDDVDYDDGDEVVVIVSLRMLVSFV